MDTGFAKKIPVPIDQSCVGYWKLDETSGTIKDLSGNGNTGSVYGTITYLFVRNASDNSVWYNKWNGTTMSGWTSLGGTFVSNISAISSGSNIFVFARTSDGSVMYNNWNDSTWSDWQNIGCCFASNITAASSGSNIFVFARSGTNDIYTRSWNGSSGWGSWQNIGCCFVSDIAATTSSGGNITIFARGADDAVYTRNWNGSSWNNWQSLGGTITSEIATTSSGNNITIFARGTEYAEWTKNWNGEIWSNWLNIGGVLASDTAATSSGNNISIFVKGTDNGVYTQNWNGITWSGWLPLGGTFVSNIAATSSGNNISIFGRNMADNIVYTKNWNGSVWSNWLSLDKVIAGDPSSALVGLYRVSGKFGNALKFDGIDDYVSIGTNNLPVGSNDLSIEAWVNIQDYIGYNVFVAFGTMGSNQRVALYSFDTLGTLSIGFYGNDHDSTAVIPLNSWHHIAGTKIGTTSKLYLDGVLVSTKSDHTGINIIQGTARIGADLNNYWFVNGAIDDVRIYNRASSSQEIKRHYMAGR